jgi:lipopolysaccharide biosynthesis glycosyltransferase
MFSILKNKKASDEIMFHLLIDQLNEKQENKFNALVEKSKAAFKIHQIDKNRFDGLNMNYSIYSWFRILIPEVVDQNISKVLYIDCDTIVNSNLDYIFNLDLAGNAIAVVDSQSSNQKTFDRLKYPVVK